MEYFKESYYKLKVNKNPDSRSTEFYKICRDSLKKNIKKYDFSLNQFNKEFNFLLNKYISKDNDYYESILFGYINMLFNKISYGAKSKTIQKLHLVPDLIELVYYNKEWAEGFKINLIEELIFSKEVIKYIKHNYKEIEIIRRKLLMEIKLNR